jgi:hypothetical protein
MGCTDNKTIEYESIKLINFQNNANPTQKKKKNMINPKRQIIKLI